MIQDITCVFEGVGSVGAIFISNLRAAQNATLLNHLSIKAIVTAVRGGIVKHDKTDVSDHLYVPADDIESYDLARHFEETYHFIQAARKKTNVLVHCYAGISRSATIVVAYLIRKYNYSLQRVLTMVKRKRSKINPNKGFVEQLKKQAERIGIVSNENQQPIETLLQKCYSVERKRGYSSVKRARGDRVGVQVQNRISLGLAVGRDGVGRIGESKEKDHVLTGGGRDEDKIVTCSFIKLQMVPIQPEKQPSPSKQPQPQPPIAQKSFTSLSDKQQKIELLKSRVLQSHSRKHLPPPTHLSHKHSLSQYKANPRVQFVRKEQGYPGYQGQYESLSAVVSAKLAGSGGIYEVCKSVFSPEKAREKGKGMEVRF